MSILTGDEMTTVREAAVGYLSEGLSIIPLVGKQAAVPWSLYQTQRARTQDLNWWASTGRFQNIGIVCGAVSGNLIVMDLDGKKAIELFRSQFPELLDTFTVATGSGRGEHVYLRVDELPPSRRWLQPGHAAIELRSSGLYVAAPPSIHPDTKLPYFITEWKRIKVVSNLNRLKTWLDGMIEAGKPPPVPKPKADTFNHKTTAKANNQAGIHNPTAWTNAAIRREQSAVQHTAEGGRNLRLNTAAYNLGQIVGIGWLTWATAESALLDAARGAGLGERESLATIHSGLNRGIEHRRDLQWQKRSPQ